MRSNETSLDMYTITLTTSIETAHFLRKYKGGDDEPLHGHTIRVDVSISSPTLNNEGMVADFLDLENIVNDVIENPFDHHVINEVSPFDNINPTAEHLAYYFWQELTKHFPHPFTVHLRVWETSSCSASYSE